MGNQNATAVTEEEEATNETPSNSSNENAAEDSETKDEQLIPAAVPQESADDFLPGSAGDGHEEDQTLDHIKEEDGNDINEGIGVTFVEPVSNEIQGSENPAFAVKDDDVLEDQGIEGTTLNPIAGASHEPNDLATLDVKEDDHVLEKNNEDLSLHVSEVSAATSSSIDEISIQSTKEEIGHLMVAKLSETEEEKVNDEVDIPEQLSSSTSSKDLEVNEEDSSSNVSHNQEVILHSPVASSEPSSTEDEMIGHTGDSEGVEASTEEETGHQGIDENANQMNFNDQKIEEDQIEAVKDVTDTSLHIERYDPDTNNPASPQHSKDEETNPGSLDHGADFKDLEIIECNPTYESLHLERHDQEDTNNPASSDHVAVCKDLEIVHAKASPDPLAELSPPRSKTNSTDLTKNDNSSFEAVPDDNHNTRSTIDKSPSFEFMNLDTKTEQSDQTPLLYQKKKAPMRSLSTPVTARFLTPLALNENGHFSAEERTINIVDYDQKLPRSPLNGFLKDQEEETHLLKPQTALQEAKSNEAQKELCNGHGMVELQGSRNRRRSKARMSGSYFFSSCICCARVEQLADP